MMRKILFIHANPNTGKLLQLVKEIPYAPEDQTMYFIDISKQDMEMLGTKHLNYLNNCYEDNIPYVWPEQPSHIASVDMPMPYMRLRLLKAIKTEYLILQKALEQRAIQSEFTARTLLYPETPPPSVVFRGDKVYAVSRDLFGVQYWFCLRMHAGDAANASENLRQMIYSAWSDSRKNFRQQQDRLFCLLSELDFAIEAVETEIHRL